MVSPACVSTGDKTDLVDNYKTFDYTIVMQLYMYGVVPL